MTLVAEGPPKLCPDCGFKRPRSDFYATRKKSTGVIYAKSYCKQHDKARTIAYLKSHWKRKRENDRRVYERIVGDPERYAIRLDQMKVAARRRRGTPASMHRVTHRGQSGGSRLDPAPFATWLTTLASGPTDIGRVVGLDEAQVRRYLNHERQVTLDVVDAALLEASTATLLDDLYPLQGDNE